MEPAHILLVEDSAGDKLLVQQVLASCPVAFKLHVARDGEQALQMLADANLEVDLIILDLNLPKICGLGVLERYHPKDTPVVVFSASSRQTDKRYSRWRWVRLITFRNRSIFRVSQMWFARSS